MIFLLYDYKISLSIYSCGNIKVFAPLRVPILPVDKLASLEPIFSRYAPGTICHSQFHAAV